jgi:lipoyl(octanoyl) transferase
MAEFDLEENIFFQKNNSTLYIEKWNWDYEEAHHVQLACVEHVLKNENDVIFIFCSHPTTFTMGRGLQKLKNESEYTLIEFDRSLKSQLHIPVIDIKRGGGLTFHHPGQFIFYPILKTTEHNLKVHDFMLMILELTKNILIDMNPDLNLRVNQELLGLWGPNFKLASIGLAVNRFVTYHGLALNYFSNNSMKKELAMVHPCGLPGDVYKSLDEIIDVTAINFESFKNIFQNKIYEMIERQRSSLPIFNLTSSIVSDKKWMILN